MGRLNMGWVYQCPHYRIGACPYLLGITIFCPCKGRRVQLHNELCAPYRGKIMGKHKRRGKPLRYILSSLRDLSVAKFLPDANSNQYRKGRQHAAFVRPFMLSPSCCARVLVAVAACVLLCLVDYLSSVYTSCNACSMRVFV